MAIRTQLRRGTTTDNNNFKGAPGELTMDTTTKGLRIHDGSTTGGFKIDTLVAFQEPNAGNGYKWYRKYASGWVEQGQQYVYCAPRTAGTIFTYPITMKNPQNIVLAVVYDGGDNYTKSVYIKAQTQTCFIGIAGCNGGTPNAQYINWVAYGMAA